MRTIFSILIAFILIFTSCKSQRRKSSNITKAKTSIPTNKNTLQRGTLIKLEEGQTLFVDEHQFNISFKKTIQDTRCPKNANCIWAGNATIEIEIMGTTSRPKNFELSIGDLRDKMSNSAEYLGYKLSLQDLTPILSANREEQETKYEASIFVEKITN